MAVIRVCMDDNAVTVLDFRGDVEMTVSDGAISVYDYERRKLHPETNGLVFSATPGNWVWARSFTDEEAAAQANYEGPIHDAS